jgi:hypothetical protein
MEEGGMAEGSWRWLKVVEGRWKQSDGARLMEEGRWRKGDGEEMVECVGW